MLKRLAIIAAVILAICIAITYPVCRGRFLSWKSAEAVKQNNVALVRSLLDKGISADTKNSEGMPLLLLAVANGNKEMTNLLLDEGADINVKLDSRAISFGHPFCTGPLSVSSGGMTALQLAVMKGDKELTQLLLDKGADADIQVDLVTFSTVNPINEELVVKCIGGTALHFAVALKNRELVEILLPKTTNVNTESDGTTPLNMAVSLRNVEIVKALLKQGAEANTKSNDNLLTPLRLAVMCISDSNCPDPEIAKQLLIFGADVDGKFSDSETKCLQTDRIDRRSKIVKLLSERTPLNIACGHQCPELVKLLLDYGANVNAKDQKGQTALDIATEKGYTDVAEVLRKHGAKTGAEMKQF
ncbi:MAG: ankyrin repeat domain-containing protein [Sedimentisphaerales bacterium]|nr:ankyrin repeat domain-containing protein [Sedimentisphaerales bacterium]